MSKLTWKEIEDYSLESCGIEQCTPSVQHITGKKPKMKTWREKF